MTRCVTSIQTTGQLVTLQRHLTIVAMILRVAIEGIVRVYRFTFRTNESCVQCYDIERIRVRNMRRARYNAVIV